MRVSREREIGVRTDYPRFVTQRIQSCPAFILARREAFHLHASFGECGEQRDLHWVSGCKTGGARFETTLVATDWGPAYVPSSDPGMGKLLFMRDGTLMAQSFDARQLVLIGEPVNVAEQLRSFAHYGYFSVSTNGVLVYRTGGAGEDRQLTWFDRQGKVLGTAGDAGDYVYPALSPDGKRAAIGRRDPQTGKLALWIVDFSRGTSTRFTFGSFRTDYPIWSPDGNRIIFTSNIGGTFDIYQKAATGATAEEPLLKSKENKVSGSLSRDGRFLMYSADGLETKSDLWVLPFENGNKSVPVLANGI